MVIFRFRPGSVGLAFCLAVLLGAAASSADVQHLIASETAHVASVSSHADGGFTVAWITGALLDTRIYLQRFEAAGTPAAPKRLVSEALIYNRVLVSTDTALGEPFPPALDTAAFDTCAATPALVGN